MTDITRVFNVETRAFTNVERKYSGQINDSVSTTLHFEYNPIGFLDENSGYKPYIVFNVHDENGNPLVYGKDSTPVFDGWEFSIPWDVTSRVKTQRVEYQLFFVRNNIVFNGSVAQLDSTEYIQSAMDGIALKRSIECKKKNTCCPPMAPTTEPSVVGYINLWKDYGMVVPVEQSYDPDTKMLQLIFHTYNGTNDCIIDMRVPPLIDDKIPHEFLDLVESIDYTDGLTEEWKIPTAKAVIDWLVEEYTSKNMSIAEWDSERTYSRNSTVTYNENIYISISDDNIGHEPVADTTQSDEWWSTLTEYDVIANTWDNPATNKAPSVAMTKTALDGKIDDTQLVTEWSATPSDSNIPSEKLTKDSLDGKLDDTQLVTTWNEPTDSQIASAKLTKDSLDTKFDTANVTQEITTDTNTVPSNSAVKTALDAKMDDAQLVTEWNEPTDAQIASAKLVKDSLDDKTDYRMAIRPWETETTYTDGSTVIYNGTIYISRGVENRGHVPSDASSTGVWWSKIEGGSGESSGQRYVDIIGNGVDTVYNVHHGLGTSDVFYAMRFNDSQRMFTDANVYIIDDNTVRVETYMPLPTDSVVIVLTPSVSSGSTKVETIGNGIDREFVIEHDFGTYNYFTSIRDMTTGLFVRANVFALDSMRAKIVFTNPPATSSLRVVMTTAMKSSSSDASTYSFTDESTWVIRHGLERLVMVQTYDSVGNVITGNVKQDMSTLNVVTIEFSEPMSGVAIVR